VCGAFIRSVETESRNWMGLHRHRAATRPAGEYESVFAMQFARPEPIPKTNRNNV